MDRLVAYLAAGVPTIVVFVFVSTYWGYLFGLMAYGFSVVMAGELFKKYALGGNDNATDK